MEENGILSKSLISDTHTWRLALRISQKELWVILYNTVDDGSLICRKINLGSSTSHIRALEDAIYDNPLLLGDFERVYIVVETQCFLTVPTESASEADDCELMMRTAFPEFGGVIIPCDTGDREATILAGLDAELAGFLNRTFIAPRIAHNLSPLSRYFSATTGRGNGVKICVNMRPDSLDIVAVDRNRLLLANTFAFREMDDALYYILACRRQLDLQPGDDELFLAGDAGLREQLMPRLREWVRHVAPVIFPSRMFAAGKDAMKAPFDLIVMPLCE